jgi:transcription initiation factor TFIIIB Brf1 subunit/transcription initiation factor TFIIB
MINLRSIKSNRIDHNVCLHSNTTRTESGIVCNECSEVIDDIIEGYSIHNSIHIEIPNKFYSTRTTWSNSDLFNDPANTKTFKRYNRLINASNAEYFYLKVRKVKVLIEKAASNLFLPQSIVTETIELFKSYAKKNRIARIDSFGLSFLYLLCKIKIIPVDIESLIQFSDHESCNEHNLYKDYQKILLWYNQKFTIPSKIDLKKIKKDQFSAIEKNIESILSKLQVPQSIISKILCNYRKLFCKPSFNSLFQKSPSHLAGSIIYIIAKREKICFEYKLSQTNIASSINCNQATIRNITRPLLSQLDLEEDNNTSILPNITNSSIKSNTIINSPECEMDNLVKLNYQSLDFSNKILSSRSNSSQLTDVPDLKINIIINNKSKKEIIFLNFYWNSIIKKWVFKNQKNFTLCDSNSFYGGLYASINPFNILCNPLLSSGMKALFYHG